jgi:hypothetical protein
MTVELLAFGVAAAGVLLAAAYQLFLRLIGRRRKRRR